MWFDYSAGSVITSAMYDYLHYPVLTPGRSAKDACSLPVPHVYTYYALAGGDLDLLHSFSNAVPPYVGAITSALCVFFNLYEVDFAWAKYPLPPSQGGNTLCNENVQRAEQQRPPGGTNPRLGGQAPSGRLPRKLLPYCQP